MYIGWIVCGWYVFYIDSAVTILLPTPMMLLKKMSSGFAKSYVMACLNHICVIRLDQWYCFWSKTCWPLCVAN